MTTGPRHDPEQLAKVRAKLERLDKVKSQLIGPYPQTKARHHEVSRA